MATQEVVTLSMAGFRMRVRSDLVASVLYCVTKSEERLSDAELFAQFVRHGDRVLQLGGGTGVVGALLAKISRAPVIIAEPDDELHSRIIDTFAINDVDGILIPAFPARDPEPGPHEVCVYRLDVLIAEHNPSVILVRTQGLDIPAFRDALTSAIRLVVIERSGPLWDANIIGSIVAAVTVHGFALQGFGSNTWAFGRA